MQFISHFSAKFVFTEGLVSSNSTPKQLYKYLHTSGHQALKIMPSVKYDMRGIKISMMKTFPGATQAKNDFIASLGIKGFIPEGRPSLTIGSSSNDKMSMTATNIQLTVDSPNSTKITATFIPNYYEIETQFGLSLEIQMGYEFSGKITRFPSIPTLNKQPAAMVDQISTGLLVGGALIGTTIFCVLAGPEVTVGCAIIGDRLLIARS